MNAAASHEIGVPPARRRPITAAQRTAAKVSGTLYLLLMLTGVWAEFFARAPLIVAGDAAATAAHIAAAESLFRAGMVANLVTFAGTVPLLVALYVIVEPINRAVALLAVAWRVVETAVLAMIAMIDFAVLRLLAGTGYLQPIETEQLQALARVLLALHSDGYRIGVVFLGLGSALFAYLLLKSRYVPAALALWGMFASTLLAATTLAIMLVPALAPLAIPGYYLPMMSFEIALGLWLVSKGLHGNRRDG